MELDFIALLLMVLGLGVGVFLGVLYTSQNLYWRGYEVTWIIINDVNALLPHFRTDESGENQVLARNQSTVAAVGKVTTQATCNLNSSQLFFIQIQIKRQTTLSSTICY